MLQIEQVTKIFGQNIRAVDGVSLTVETGEILALLGPSGCGKTTLLRIIAGLETMDTGAVTLDGQDLTRIPIHRRNFGFMFQDFALFPHQSVAENIAFGLRMRSESARAIAARVDAMLELVNLPGYGARTIFELSGGERQRVALARSLAPNPRLLMLDEPLGSLDRNLRESLALELRTILGEVGVTAIYVTHDQQEALVMSDRLVIMNRGRIEQQAPPQQLYSRPATEFVARFLGFRNLLPIRISDKDSAHETAGATTQPMFATPIGPLPAGPLLASMDLPKPEQSPVLQNAGQKSADPKSATLLIRPESARLARADSSDPENNSGRVRIGGTLTACYFLGVEYRIEVEVVDHVGDFGGKPYSLTFDLPTHQTEWESGLLKPIDLPPVNSPIALLLYPELMSLIAKAPSTPQAESDATGVA